MNKCLKPIVIMMLFLLTALWQVAICKEEKMQLNLMPVPAEIELTGGKFRLDETFTMSVRGECGERLYAAATRTLRRLGGRTGLFFSQDYITEDTTNIDTAFIAKVNREGKVVLNEDESYRLVITEDKIELNAETDIGAIRGFETFLQLLSVDKNGYYFPTVEVNDYPRFPWRGLLIDVSRHFMPVEVIKRNLDGMAAVKMNVLHWHLTDDQGFRIECKTFPKLHEMGSDGLYYTQEQIKEIVAYANDRGIRVIPEFDMPAHTTSWFVGHPELASAPGPYTVERGWGIKDPTMDPTKEYTYEFLDKFFKEMTALFPDEYFHIGGDENTGKHWDANPEIQEFMKENNIPDNHALQSYFNNRVLQLLTKYNKKMVGWDEILHPDMPKNIVIQSWRGREALIESAKKGYKGILSNGYYVDLMQTAEYHYLNDPIPEDSALTEEERKNILGGEACSWGELVSPETIDSRIWPRTAAIAERFWSPQYIKDVEDMYRRLEVVSFRLEELDLTHIKNYNMMLRRLTNNNDITSLKTLVDVVEPVKMYQRHHQGVEYTSYSPLSRVVDAARPESVTARHFGKLVDEYLTNKDKNCESEIISWLELWRDNHKKLGKIIEMSPILKEIETLSEDLSIVSGVGLRAIHYISRDEKAPWWWVKRSLNKLERAKEPRGQTELMVAKPIEKLVLKSAE